jgi:peptide/nickel transport system ATP-binding protein
MANTILDVRNLQVKFFTDNKPTLAVDGIDFQLKRGEKLGIVGESGSGKSVTSLAIMGLVPSPGKITEGEIIFQRTEEDNPVELISLKEEKKRLYRGGAIAMIFQEPMSALNPVYNIGFQICEAILLHEKIHSAEARRRAIGLLQEVKLIPSDAQLKKQYLEDETNNPEPSDREIDEYINKYKRNILERYPHQLSGGQLQRVTIAMAISCNPAILLADEPTTALDVTVQATILELLKELCTRRGMSLIFITHDLGVISQLVDSVAVMYQGKIVEFGDIASIFTNPQHPYTKGLLSCRPQLDRQLKYLPTVTDFMEVTTNENGEAIVVEKNNRLELETVNNTEASARLFKLLSKSPLLEVKNLRVGFPIKGMFGETKRYFMAVNNISFDVRPGETLGLVGESGCGKSTLARTLLLLIPRLGGQILFENEEISNLKDTKHLRALRSNMQIVFQNPYSSLNPRMTVGKAIMEPLVVHNVGKSHKERLKRVSYLLERVGLDERAINRYPHEFSGGQRQRVCIARALALNPKFIICDESVSALDVSVQAQVLNLLKELQQEFGLTYIFISHDLNVVKFMSDRIMVMNKGEIEEIDTAEEIYRQPKTDYTQNLIASIPSHKF